MFNKNKENGKDVQIVNDENCGVNYEEMFSFKFVIN